MLIINGNNTIEREKLIMEENKGMVAGTRS